MWTRTALVVSKFPINFKKDILPPARAGDLRAIKTSGNFITSAALSPIIATVLSLVSTPILFL